MNMKRITLPDEVVDIFRYEAMSVGKSDESMMNLLMFLYWQNKKSLVDSKILQVRKVEIVEETES